MSDKLSPAPKFLDYPSTEPAKGIEELIGYPNQKQCEYTPIPEDRFSIVPKDLQQSTFYLIFYLDHAFKAEGLKNVRLLYHYWMYGRRKGGDTNSVDPEHDPPYYAIPFQNFLGDDSFSHTLSTAKQRALATCRRGNDKGTELGKFLADTAQRLIGSLKEGATSTVKRLPSWKDLRKFYPPVQKELPEGVMRIASAHIGFRDAVKDDLGLTLTASETASALGSVNISSFASIRGKRVGKKKIEFLFDNLAFAFVDSFDYEGSDPLGIWNLKTGFETLRTGVAMLKEELGRDLRGTEMLRDQHFRKFKQEFMPAYNRALARYTVPEGREMAMLKGMDFRVISTVYIDEQYARDPLRLNLEV